MARRDEPAIRRQRARIADEVARLLAEGAESDPARARRKVAERLGVRDEAALPGGDEIRAAVLAYRQLFAPADGGRLRAQREAALAAMQHFAHLDPRLAGPVLDGSADARTPVTLHLHADDPDAVTHALLERDVPARQSQAAVRLDRRQRIDVPAWRFSAGGVDFELLQLPLSAARQAPWDPLEDRPLERAGIAALRRLLDAAG
ncbi:hypothetical protein [Arenimonas composti]|uniref:Uncharacterized protein n=1 Tax=Arenimonas composti TR7-09 = DSM 18010 TaxID=1121013 RepID=A0A091BCX0_9GAMM|nr:hypothetical protein [Arenimonas composti]KFN49362.1 hypothetical protein P873_11355 [Arenimonas composti TR7-09 = DSM 18010]